MNMNFTEEPKCLTERFVEALSLETQTGEIKWRFRDGYGTPAKCICEGRELTIIPDYSDPDQDGYTLYSAAIDGTDSCMLMSEKEFRQCLTGCEIYTKILPRRPVKKPSLLWLTWKSS